MENKETEQLEIKEEVKKEEQVEEEIVFHDSTPQVVEQPKGDMNKLAIIGFVLVIISTILAFIPTQNMIVVAVYNISSIGGFILSIIALIQIRKKNQKGKAFAISGIVLPILTFIISMIIGVITIANMPEEEINDLIYCPYATDCVDNKDGTSKCLYVDDTEVTCTTEILNKEQFK